MITEKILVVDDESTICDSVKKILSRKGYSVENTLNANDAIERIKKEKFDIVITDLMMPQVSGMELLELVKKYYPEIDVLVITGYATVETAVKATKLGALDYIQKPFTPNELMERIQKAIELRNNKKKEAIESIKTENEKAGEVIDVDMPFAIEEIEKATSKEFVNKLTRSDIPVSKKYIVKTYCEKGSRDCKIYTKTMTECKGECAEIKREKKAMLKKGTTMHKEGLIDVDMPFNLAEVENEIGSDYLDCMDRSDYPRAALYGKNIEARKSVLVVDDEPIVCHSVRRILTKQNCSVEEAFDVEVAQKKIKNNKYDLIFLDLKMPKKDGLEVLTTIKENYPDTPVIMITGYGTIEKAIEATKLGAYQFIPKPFTPEELKEVALEVLA